MSSEMIQSGQRNVKPRAAGAGAGGKSFAAGDGDRAVQPPSCRRWKRRVRDGLDWESVRKWPLGAGPEPGLAPSVSDAFDGERLGRLAGRVGPLPRGARLGEGVTLPPE